MDLMSKIHTVILDYGGVYSFDYSIANYRSAMLQAFGTSPSEQQRNSLKPAFRELSRGQIATSEYVKVASDLLYCARPPTDSSFESAIVKWTLPPSPEMLELVWELRRDGYQVGLLSDMCEFELRKTRPTGRFSGFDFTSFSTESGLVKQDTDCFSSLLDRQGLSAGDVLFVDDSRDNIDMAARAGLHTIFADKRKYERAQELCQAIRTYLLKSELTL